MRATFFELIQGERGTDYLSREGRLQPHDMVLSFKQIRMRASSVKQNLGIGYLIEQ